MVLSKAYSWFSLTPILLVTAIAYFPLFTNHFVAFDDPLLITENPIVRTFSMEHVMEAFTTFDPELYIPLPILSYQIEYLFFGPNPLVVHLDNLLLHLLCITLVFFLIDQLFKKRFVTMLVTVLFALHPINVEAVAWAAARKDLLAAVFALATCLVYLHAQHTKRRSTFLLALALFLCGLLSKVTIIGLPFVLLMIDMLQGASARSPREWKRLLPFFALSLLFFIIALFGKSEAWALHHTSIGGHLLLSLIGLFFPLAQFFFLMPSFSVLYPLRNVPLLPVIILGIAIIPFLIVSITRSGQTMRRAIAFGVMLYGVMLAPSLANLFKAGETYAGSDRYAYLPLIGVFLLIALLLYQVLRKQWMQIALPILVAVTLAPLTAFQVGVWSDTGTLFVHTLAQYPDSSAAHFSIGSLCLDGKKSVCALTEYQRAAAILPDARNNTAIGAAYAQMHDDTKAEVAYRTALTIDPTYGNAFMGLGMIAYRKGDIDAQIALLNQALKWTSDRVSLDDRVFIHTNLAAAYALKGDHQQEILHEREAIRLDPLFAPAHYNLATALEEAGQQEEAQKERKKAYALDPSLRTQN